MNAHLERVRLILCLCVWLSPLLPSVSLVSALSADVESLKSNSTSSSSFLVWQFCHFSRGVALDWTVSTTGLLVTTPLYLQPDISRQLGYYSVVSISGSRTQTTVNSSESQLLTGIVPYGGFQDNDNILMSGGAAVLSPTGISYQLDRSVAVPGGSLTPQTRINLYMFHSPPIENDQDKDSIGLAYFAFSPGNTDKPFPCPPPVAQVYSFLYYTAPTTYDNGLFSSCSSGTFRVLGPYSYFDYASGAEYWTFITEDASGFHVFANQTTTQRVAITGVSAQGGSDFTLYSMFPYADLAGLTVTLSNASQAPGQGVSWVQITSPDNAAMVETGLYAQQNRMDIQVAPFDAAVPLATCSVGVKAMKWDFCFIATGMDGGGRWAVQMNGTILSTPNINSSVPSYYATAAMGQRLQVSSSGVVTVTNISGVQSFNGDVVTPNDNRLYVRHPTLSTAGLTLIFSPNDPPVQLPLSSAGPVWFTTLTGSPPRERFVAQSGVDFSSFVYQASPNQFDINQPASLSCAVPVEYQKQVVHHLNASVAAFTQPLASGILQTLYFYYSAVPGDAEANEFGSSWSICTEGTFSAIGPYTYGSDEVYQVISLSGSRLFLDRYGVSSTSALTGVSFLNGGNQLLYIRFPGVDSQGLTLTMTPNPLFPNVDNNTASSWVHLSNGSGETTAFTVPNTRVILLFSNNVNDVPSCIQPGNELKTSQNGLIMLLGTAIALIGYSLSMMAVELTYVAFMRRRLVTMVAWLALAILATALSSWAAIATCFASINVQCPDCVSPITLSYRLDVLLLAWLPSVLCSTTALLVMVAALKKDEVRRMRERKVHPETSSGPLGLSETRGSTTRDQSTLTLPSVIASTMKTEGTAGPLTDLQGEIQRVPQRGWLASQWAKAMQTWRRLWMCVTIHLLPGGVLMAAALVLTRYTLTSMLVTQASNTSLTVVDVLVSLVVVILSSVALLWIFFGQHFRFMPPVLLAGALLLDFELHFITNSVTYQPQLPKLSNAPISLTALLIITGLTGFCHLVAISYTVIHRIQTTKRLMAARIKRATSKLNNAQTVISTQKQRIHSLTHIGLEAMRAIDCIAALRPVQADQRLQSDKQQRAMAESLLWSSLTRSSSAALLDSALHRSARLIAPVLFSSAAEPRQSVMHSRTHSNGTPARRDSALIGGSSTPSGALVAQVGLRNGKSAWGQLAPRSSLSTSSGDSATYGGSTIEGNEVRSPPPEASLISRDETMERNMEEQLIGGDQTLVNGLRKLLKPPALNEATEEDRLLRHLNGLPNMLTEAGVVKEVLFCADQRKTKEGSATLKFLAATALKYSPTLEHVLSHPVTAELLKDHMQQAASVENLLFLVRLEQWKAVENSALKRSLATFVLDEFIRDGSTSQINISAAQSELLIRTISKGRGVVEANVFAEAEKEVLTLIRTNNWKTFTRTPAYTMSRAILVRNTAVLSALQLYEDSIDTRHVGSEQELDILLNEASTHNDDGDEGGTAEQQPEGSEGSVQKEPTDESELRLGVASP